MLASGRNRAAIFTFSASPLPRFLISSWFQLRRFISSAKTVWACPVPDSCRFHAAVMAPQI